MDHVLAANQLYRGVSLPGGGVSFLLQGARVDDGVQCEEVEEEEGEEGDTPWKPDYEEEYRQEEQEYQQYVEQYEEYREQELEEYKDFINDEVCSVYPFSCSIWSNLSDFFF